MTERDPGGPSITSMSPSPPNTQSYDPEAVRAKYLAERDRRLVAGRADIRDLEPRRVLRPLPRRPLHRRRRPRSRCRRGRCRHRRRRHRRRHRRRPPAQGRDRAASASSTRPAASAAPGIGTAIPASCATSSPTSTSPCSKSSATCPTQRYAFGEEIRLHLDAAGRALRPGRRRAVPHRDHPGRVARGRGSLAHPDRPGRRRQLPLVRDGRGHPQPDEAPGHRGHGELRRSLLPYRRAGTTTTPAAARRPMTNLKDKAVALVGTGASGIQVLPPLAEVGQARLRLPAHALGHRRAGQPPHR